MSFKNKSSKLAGRCSVRNFGCACNACISAINPKKISKFTKPFIDERGTLVIPADADPRYFYWAKCGQSIFETLRELNVSDEIWKRYTDASEAPF